jgi:hypothetical protein
MFFRFRIASPLAESQVSKNLAKRQFQTYKVKLGGNLLVVKGTWSNVVSSNKAAEGGGTPIPLHGNWNAFLLSDGKGGYSITLNSFDVLQ